MQMSAPTTHVWINDPQVEGDDLVVSCTIERPHQDPARLWYRFPQAYATALNPRADAFVIAALFLAMRSDCPMRVHAEVSASLLRNLEEFQGAWSRYVPAFHTIDMVADRERSDPLPGTREQAIFGFSGGVDSTFLLYRHTRRLAGRRTRKLGAGLLVHGFDIPLSEVTAFEVVAARSKQLLNDEGIDLIRLSTNYRQVENAWTRVCGAALAACEILFAGRYGAGLISSSEPYEHPILAWGSSPVTDYLLSSDDFPIVHDGADYGRADKVAIIGNWDTARRNLRVCWAGPRPDANCCVCEKCIRTILCFRALGLGLPTCFERDVTDQDILALRKMTPLQVNEMELIVETAHARQIEASWLEALERVILGHKVGFDSTSDPVKS
jgi:hypothetical protein